MKEHPPLFCEITVSHIQVSHCRTDAPSVEFAELSRSLFSKGASMERNFSTVETVSVVVNEILAQPTSPSHSAPETSQQPISIASDTHDSVFTAERTAPRSLLFALFTLSGFSGLIYESIWTHYLKLFLGHAAYAQTLVLVLFMGGMAGGSWLAARSSHRWHNLLIRYAVIEGLIGILALTFHPLFTTTTAFAYTHLLPTFDSPFAASLVKWSLASALILPQCLLLGMTFPLMSGGLLRRFPEQKGATIAMLYFTNSLGAAVGVLVSGFVLVGMVGLPGTIRLAGLLNLALALVMWLVAKDETSIRSPRLTWVEQRKPSGVSFPPHLLLLVALITGASSFMYEIGWIRMLSLVLGSSTHSFELMLSAFILGLACGGLWIERTIDRLPDQLWFLGMVQLAMGLLALATLPLYGHTFGFFAFMMHALSKTDAGYILFNLSAHAVSLFIMLPATFCAGMTLPLLTAMLLRTRQGESAIGNVYAANTLGAILGVMIAVHVILPMVGLKGLIMAGAALDIGLSWFLLGMGEKNQRQQGLLKPVVLGTGALLVVFVGTHLSPYLLASGVFRHGSSSLPEGTRILFHQDGKTATVTLAQSQGGLTSLHTNGKPDAAIEMKSSKPDSDEITMTMIGALALGFHFEAKTAANIGMGSGMTADTLLSSPYLQRLDTIEIEPAMVAAAKGLRPRVEAVFSDPRSRIHYEDAKTFFSTRKHQYDIIASEPSNPWVSGVSGLFSHEFYQLVRHYLQPDGIFIQWVQDYEFSAALFSSIEKALGQNFSDYVMFNTNYNDVLIVARNHGAPGVIDSRLFTHPPLAKALARVGLKNMQDVEVRRIGTKALLAPFFSSFHTPANSDYFPFVDQHAVKSRFLNNNSQVLSSFGLAPLPVLEMLGGEHAWLDKEVTGASYYPRADKAADALTIIRTLNGSPETVDSPLPLRARQQIAMVTLPWQECATPAIADAWIESLFVVARNLFPYTSPQALGPLWARIEATPCAQTLSQEHRQWLALFKAVGNRNGKEMATIAQALVNNSAVRSNVERLTYVVATRLLGLLSQGRMEDARMVWEQYQSFIPLRDGGDLYLRLLMAHTQSRKGETLVVATQP